MPNRDDADFEAFAASAWPRLRWSAYLLVGDHHLAEDLTQTALARTYAAWRRVRRDDAIGYARKVLVNANIDRMRLRRVAEVPVPTHREHRPGPDPTDRLDQRDEVVRLLGDLGAQERRVLVLRYVYDLSEAAIAEELGISRGTVKSAASRSLAKLRAQHAGAPGASTGPSIPAVPSPVPTPAMVPDAARVADGE